LTVYHGINGEFNKMPQQNLQNFSAENCGPYSFIVFNICCIMLTSRL